VRPLDTRTRARRRHDRAVRGVAARRRVHQLRPVLLRLRRARVGRVQAVHQCRQRPRRPEGLQGQQLRRPADGRVHHPAQQLRARPHSGIFPRSPRRARHLPRQVDLCALRDHRQRDPARTQLGRPCHAGVLEHDAAPREDLRQRGRVPVPVPAGERAVRGQLRRPRRQISGAARGDAAQAL
ncbi:MAG: Deoxycytidine triphosphate deaminase, partial [uncultured Sphingomonadaceae bacterium]